MFVMVMSVRRSNTVTETVSKEINHDLNNLKNINCINNHLRIIHNNTNSSCCTIDKTIKRILPIAVDTTTILSPSALTSAQSAQNPNKFLLTELNNYRKPPTLQVRVDPKMVFPRSLWPIWSVIINAELCSWYSAGTSGHHIKRFEPSACCTGKGL